jgi:hypothetical protein
VSPTGTQVVVRGEGATSAPYRAIAAVANTGRELLLDDADAGLAPIAATLAEAATLLWPDLDHALARAGATGARRVPASLNVPAVAMFPRLTTALGVGPLMLYQRDSGPDVSVACAATPIVVIGPRLAGGAGGDVVRAQLARAIDLARPEHLVFGGLSLEDASRLVAAVARLFGPPALRDAVTARIADPDVQRAHDEMVRAALSVKLRTRLEHQLATLSPAAADAARYTSVCQRDADRAALLVGGDPGTIVAGAVQRGDGARHLIRAIAHPGWLAFRGKLGLGVR